VCVCVFISLVGQRINPKVINLLSSQFEDRLACIRSGDSDTNCNFPTLVTRDKFKEQH
jgi:hypothetical protein